MATKSVQDPAVQTLMAAAFSSLFLLRHGMASLFPVLTNPLWLPVMSMLIKLLAKAEPAAAFPSSVRAVKLAKAPGLKLIRQTCARRLSPIPPPVFTVLKMDISTQSTTGSGVKFCWTNTGNSSAKNYGEVVCLIDTNPVGTGGENCPSATPPSLS